MNNERTASYHREQRVAEVLADYLENARTGQAPDRRELLARHPDLAAELEEFFADHGWRKRRAAATRDALLGHGNRQSNRQATGAEFCGGNC
jgi:hypothetical protein